MTFMLAGSSNSGGRRTCKRFNANLRLFLLPCFISRGVVMKKIIEFTKVKRVYVCTCCNEKSVKWYKELWLFGKPFLILFRLKTPAFDKKEELK